VSGATVEFNRWREFAEKVYGRGKLDVSRLDRRWRRWYGHPQRLRVRFENGVTREGVVAITKGPEPTFVFRKNDTSGGGIPLGPRDRVVAVQTREGYQPVAR